jgi:hypothetical protein
MDDAPDMAVELDARGMKAYLTVEDGDLVLVVHDGQVGVTFEPGAGGSAEDAIRGAEHLAEMARHYAELLKVRAGSRHPLTPLNPPTEVEWWLGLRIDPESPAWAPNINTTQPIGPAPNGR